MCDKLPKNFNDEAAVFAKENGGLIGLSGGRDSVALLLMLKQVLKFPRLAACHVNHCIRGTEADADEQFCADLCKRLDVPFFCKRVDVPALAEQTGMSLEEAARAARYQAFGENQSGGFIVLAHHADDQAETVLFNMARGATGPRGMRAIDTKRGILRPLLNVTRREITDWLVARGETWRDDSTNAIADVTRNRLRHEVLPLLNDALGRDVTPTLCRAASLFHETHDALSEAIHALPTLDPQGRLYLPFVLQQSTALRKAIIHDYLRSRGVPNLSEATVLAVDAILPPGAEHSRICLPGGIMAIRHHKRLELQWPEER